MTLEKCYFCVYGVEESHDLVTLRCAHHAVQWDPTIENADKRAALLPYETPAIRDVTDPVAAQKLRDEIQGVGFNPSVDRGHSPSDRRVQATETQLFGHSPSGLRVQQESVIEGDDIPFPDREASTVEEAPKTPRDLGKQAKKRR